MSIMQGINAKIRKNPKRVIFAEGEDENMLKAAIEFGRNKLGILDPTKNGYVTNQELEDIFKLIYPTTLQGTNLKKVFKKFASIQNKLLIDYKRLQQALQLSVAQKKGSLRSG